MAKDFVKTVQEIVRAIPPGHTLSYQDVARLAGEQKAARAVARVMSRNYDPAIPCHRVIKSDGQVGGYNRGGPEKKLNILQGEGWVPPSGG